MITEDYAARPVPREAALVASPPFPAALSAHVQAAALRAAFPRYVVNVLTWWDEKPRFEVVARDASASPYCLISTDAREIWHELRQAG